jgi:DNA-binding response OmpR family regulator
MLRKALIVEDEADMGEILAEYLRRWGFNAALLLRGRPAADWVREHRPDLILFDLMLPDVDGYEVCRELKLDRQTNLIPLVMVTARTTPEDRARGLEVGADAYVTKPFTEARLRSAVAQALSWREDLERRGSRGEVRFHLRSDTRYLGQLNQMLASLFRFTPLSRDQVRQLMTAVRELGANAIEWGHRNQRERVVTVTYEIGPRKVVIVIRDTGPGFDPDRLPHAASEDDPVGHLEERARRGLREGGFGIMLARGLVDSLEYNATGNEVQLVKNFPDGGPAPSR